MFADFRVHEFEKWGGRAERGQEDGHRRDQGEVDHFLALRPMSWGQRDARPSPSPMRDRQRWGAIFVRGGWHGRGMEMLLAPLNAVGSPPGVDRKLGRPGAGRLVLARLVWPTKTTIVPAVLVWSSGDRCCVEWRPAPGAQPRKSWLPRGDVRTSLTYS